MENYNWQAVDYTTGYLLDYSCLNKQQAFDADWKAIQQISFTGNLDQDRDRDKAMFFIIEEAKETILDFS